jgi:hypothetical protein
MDRGARVTARRRTAAPAAKAADRQPRFWIAVASREHVKRGEAAGFCQVCHGKQRPLERMKPGDWVVYYSSVDVFGGSTPCQKFTAIGEITGEAVYQFRMSDDFTPYRRAVTFHPCVETPIRTLVDRLSFIRNKQRWGFMFRFGLFEIPQRDFDTIRQHMLPEGNRDRIC